MVKSILDIGNSKYKIDSKALCHFLEEAKQNSYEDAPDARQASEKTNDADSKVYTEGELEHTLLEVMQLYREYAKTENVDDLVSLKCKLEEVSFRYKSMALAEEVLSINSCLPYERRISGYKTQKGGDGLNR